MKIRLIRWLPDIIDKIDVKHGVDTDEVAEIFANNPMIRRGPKGKRRGEDVYRAYGQTNTGRYLFVAFIFKHDGSALVLSARDMEDDERRLYLRS